MLPHTLRFSALALSLPAWFVVFAHAADDPETGPAAGHSLHGEAFNEGPRQRAYLMDGTGKVSFTVTTQVELAQRFFNQGVGQLHGFWYFEAERSFRQAALLDPEMAMAYWGLAMANIQNQKRAREFIAGAVKRKEQAGPRERGWIEAYAAYYKEDKRAEKDRRRELIRAFEKIIFEHPADLEAKAFLAVLLWDSSSKGVPISSHQAVESLIGQVLAVEPAHPIHHYRIHLWDREAAERALTSAAACGQSSPGIAHMWHMPGHIFSKLNRFADAAWQQEASARIDHAHLIRDRVLPDQIHNYAHNNEWFVRNLSHVGRVHDAVALATNMIELPRVPRFKKSGATDSDTKDESGEGGTEAKEPAGDETKTADSASAYTDRPNSSYSYGRRRLVEVLSRYEQWAAVVRVTESGLVSPGKTPQDQTTHQRALGVAEFSRGNAVAGIQLLETLQALLKTEQTKEAATKKARAAGKSDAAAAAENKPVAGAVDAIVAAEKAPDPVAAALPAPPVVNPPAKKAGGPVSKFAYLENAIAELQGYAALARGENTAALEFFAKSKDLPKDRLARLQLQAGDPARAEKTAFDAEKAAPNQVPVLANYVDILQAIGKADEAGAAFDRLRAISAAIDLDQPVFQRLRPVAAARNLPTDWRLKAEVRTDSGQRPELAQLGPFRWEPSPAPAWSLPGMDGRRVALQDYRGKPVVVLFYLGHGCSHCVAQLGAFAPRTADFNKLGISLVAVSTDTVDGLQRTFEKTKTQDGFPFPLVSDPQKEVFKAYRAFDDFEDAPLHGTFLIDGQGRVRWQDIGFEPFTEIGFLLEEAERLLRLQPSNKIPGNTVGTTGTGR